MTQRELFLKAILALASSGKYSNGFNFSPHELVTDALRLLHEVCKLNPEDIDGFSDGIFDDVSWYDRVDLLEANLHAIMKKFNIEIPE